MSVKRSPGDKAPRKVTVKEEPPKEEPSKEETPGPKTPKKLHNARTENGTPVVGQPRFPAIGDLAHLAASLASVLPEGAIETPNVLVRSALSLWQAARECLIEEEQRAAWIAKITQVADRLRKIGEHELAAKLRDSRESEDTPILSWEAAGTLIFPDLSPAEQNGELALLVTEELRGRSKVWELYYFPMETRQASVETLSKTEAFKAEELRLFRGLGFERAAAATLLEIWDRRETESDMAAISLHMKAVRSGGATKNPDLL